MASPGRRGLVRIGGSMSDFGATRRLVNSFFSAECLESEDDSQLVGEIDASSVAGRRFRPRSRPRFRRGGEWLWPSGGTCVSPVPMIVEGTDAGHAVGVLAAAAATFNGTWCPSTSAARMAAATLKRPRTPPNPTTQFIVKNSGEK
jgi:hypothetical protein